MRKRVEGNNPTQFSGTSAKKKRTRIAKHNALKEKYDQAEAKVNARGSGIGQLGQLEHEWGLLDIH
jgi:hypothetical protein